MNWDITIGRGKQIVGRLVQSVGRRSDRRKLVLDGERLEYAGRLQMRYGVLKHQVQWNTGLVRFRRQASMVDSDT